MLLLKFKLLFVLSIFSLNANSMFTNKECLNTTFTTETNHKDKMTFGMAVTKLKVTKDKCEIIIDHEKLKFVKNRWKIDVCREPIHIKSGVDGVEVFKKNGPCPSKNSADYCDTLKTIQSVVQDDGLIFAEGEKEKLDTDHGRIYCIYSLVNGYLRDSRVYSRYEEVREKKKTFIKNRGSEYVPTIMPPQEVSPSTDPIPPEDKQTSGQSGSF